MDDHQRKMQVRQTFDTVAEGYGTEGMEFFQNAANHLPEVFQLKGHEHILDVATGTGIAAAVLAAHLPHGKVTGIDLSENMLTYARARAKSLDLENIELHHMDMQHIEFDNASFDAANCSFGLFFLPDMKGLLNHITSKVKTGGEVVASSFYQGSFEPHVDLFLERIQRYGVNPPDITWKQISTEAQIYDLFTEAGLSNVQTRCFDIGYALNEAEDWWHIIWFAGFRSLLMQLGKPQLEQFKEEHLAEINILRTEQGIPLNVSVLFANGRVA